MHGPYIRVGEETTARKTYLIAFLDDATRFIVGAQFFFSEAAAHVKEVLRSAILTYGIPRKLYLDNGRNFSTHDLQVAMATINCALIHATAYYPEGKGKIEPSHAFTPWNRSTPISMHGLTKGTIVRSIPH